MIKDLTTLGFYLSALPFLYFIILFYKPRYKASLTYLLTLVCLLFMLFFDLKIYTYTYQRFLLCISFLYIIITLLYTGSAIKKITGPFLSLGIIVLSETPFSYMLLNLGYTQQIIFGNNGMIILQIVIILFSMLLIFLTFHITNHILHGTRKQKVVFSLISLNFFTMSMCVAQYSVILMLKTSKLERIVYLIIMLLIAIVLDIFLLKYIRISYCSTKAKMTKILLENEYKILLESYSCKQNEFYSYLRHDLMNSMLPDNLIGNYKEKGE